MAAPTILRTQHKLGDYLFEPDLEKFNLQKKSSRPWIINNVQDLNKLKDQLNSVKDVPQTENIKTNLNMGLESSNKCPLLTSDELSNRNEQTCQNDNENIKQNREINDNAKFSANHKTTKSPKMKSKSKTKSLKNKALQHQSNNLQNKNAFSCESPLQNQDKEQPTNMNTEQESEMNGMNAQIDLEIDYQNQINMIYNNPHYLEQYTQPLQYQPEFHHIYPDYPLVGQVLYHNPCFTPQMVPLPPMYFVPMLVPCEAPSPMLMTPDTGSDYSSEDGSCYELNVSSDSSDDEVFDTSVQHEAFISNHTGVEEPDYEVPIEMDEELNLLVLSIIDD